MATPKNLDITDDQKRVLEMAIEFYIRLGLGQFSEIFTRLNLLQGKRLSLEKRETLRQLCEEMENVIWEDGKPWKLDDEETSIYTLTAALLDVQMAGRRKSAIWFARRIADLKEKIQ